MPPHFIFIDTYGAADAILLMHIFPALRACVNFRYEEDVAKRCQMAEGYFADS